MTTKYEFATNGPFPNHIDPWAEKGHYFHQIHGHMITYLLDQLAQPLYELGYLAGREASIQIAERSQPDLFIQSRQQHPPKQSNYSQAASQAELEIGIALASKQLELDRIFIKALDTGRLVTVLEIISPNNKTRYEDIQAYQQRREQLLYQEVHCVEIDLSRSIKRLLNEPISEKYPYHIAIHLHDEDARFIGMSLQDTLKAFALPLRAEIAPVELNKIYRQAYAQLSIALQILDEGHYTEDHLPFPSLLRDEDIKALLSQVDSWKAALKQAES